MKKRVPSIRWIAIGLLTVALLCPSAARSGEWRVAPIRLEFGRDAKSGVLTVVNEAAESSRSSEGVRGRRTPRGRIICRD
jgi:P pilus assembly chaperone PapD